MVGMSTQHICAALATGVIVGQKRSHMRWEPVLEWLFVTFEPDRGHSRLHFSGFITQAT